MNQIIDNYFKNKIKEHSRTIQLNVQLCFYINLIKKINQGKADIS